ncbi:MAG: acyl-CoA dehydrogenase [Candidatus Brocadiae bacterium]|nr:acyl-CoA dehydrogenase [Candidatus Brocadiia bacterium]
MLQYILYTGFYILLFLGMIFSIPVLRRFFLSSWIFKLYQNQKKIWPPEITQHEKGWLEEMFFDGKIDDKKLKAEIYPVLKEEEKDFLEGQVETLCAMVQDWEIWKKREIPKEVWDYIKKRKFLGMSIPEDFYGHGFSSFGESEVYSKIASRSAPLALAIINQNSSGLSQLLLQYGTKEQKEKYLHRIATGEEIPCLIFHTPCLSKVWDTPQGILFSEKDGKIFLRLNWNERNIPFANMATLFCIGFDLRDPDGLLKGQYNLGMSFALVPASHHGIIMDRLHDPLGIPFSCAPSEGHDVVVSVDSILGGIESIGIGWPMIQPCIARKRAMLASSQANGFSRLLFRISGAYALICNPFHEISQEQEGIEEILARIGSYSYILEASRKYTLGNANQGFIPETISHILHYHAIKITKSILDDAMELLGEKAIMRGAKNCIASLYASMPVTKILDEPHFSHRNATFFLQAVLSSHPYFREEIMAVQKQDCFLLDKTFGKHLFSFVKNLSRYCFHSISQVFFSFASQKNSLKGYDCRLSRACSAFSFLTDISIFTYISKGKINTMPYLSDVLSYLYLSICILKRYEAENEKKENLPFLEWSMEYCFLSIQNSIETILKSLQIPFFGFIFHYPLFWWIRFQSLRNWNQGTAEKFISQTMQTPGSHRNLLSENLYIPQNASHLLAHWEKVFFLASEAQKIQKKMQDAFPGKQLPAMNSGEWEEWENTALEASIITREESQTLYKFYCERNDLLQIDSFPRSEYYSL